MSESTLDGGVDTTGEWSPGDYTDGKKPGEWETSYPTKARQEILYESIYLGVMFFSCVLGIFYIIKRLCETSIPDEPLMGNLNDTSHKSAMFLGLLGAYISGTLGGCSFSIKWMYHIVAKRGWHQDRRLWRIFSPHLSGVVSLIMVFLMASGLLQLFDKTFVERPIGVMAFGFLVGYFSDKALAKMAEVADTLFGGQKKDPHKTHEKAQIR
ncbi:MAG: rane protein of unknown function [Pedosphaera sp.]|nr:rane protein of unknown function [Pedosphaera sp.]